MVNWPELTDVTLDVAHEVFADRDATGAVTCVWDPSGAAIQFRGIFRSSHLEMEEAGGSMSVPVHSNQPVLHARLSDLNLTAQPPAGSRVSIRGVLYELAHEGELDGEGDVRMPLHAV